MKNSIVIIGSEVPAEKIKEVLSFFKDPTCIKVKNDFKNLPVIAEDFKTDKKRRFYRGDFSLQKHTLPVYEIAKNLTIKGIPVNARRLSEDMLATHGKKVKLNNLNFLLAHGRKRGYFERIGFGLYRITPEGVAKLESYKGVENEKKA